jgi:FAD:protein FMN transferase
VAQLSQTPGQTIAENMRHPWLCVILVLVGCGSESPPQTTTFAGNVMTIDYKIIVGSPITAADKDGVQQIMFATFQEVNSIYNKWNPQSELSRLNQSPAKIKIRISKQLEKLLAETDKIVKLTGGRFDPTIEPLQQLWKSKLEKGTVPSESDIQTVSEAIGWDKIHFGQGVFWKDHLTTSLDLGGIAKGYCVDLLVERLNKAGFAHVFVEWGGEIRASGHHPDNRPWNIYISRLENENPDQAIATLSLVDQAIATSGDYLQNWIVFDEKSGKEVTYFHIIDPLTRRPLLSTSRSIASASVLAANCTLADGLATAAMMFHTQEEAEAWIESLGELGIQAWFYTRNKTP